MQFRQIQCLVLTLFSPPIKEDLLIVQGGTRSWFLGNNTGSRSLTIDPAGYFAFAGSKYSFNANVGINTTTPQYKLDIDANTGSVGNPIRLLGLKATSTADSVIVYRTANAGVLERMSLAQINDVAYTTVMPQLEFKAKDAVTTTGTTSITLTKIAGSPDIPTGCDFSRMQLYFKGLKQIRDIGVSTRDFKITSATSTTVTIDFYTTATTKEIAINDYFTIDVVR